MNQLLDTLNERQRYAVENTDGPMLILAGAGSGKTRTIIHKIAYLVAGGKALPDEILALTFTNKAAEEMKNRLADMGIAGAHYIWMSTFHSMGARILRRHAEKIGFTSDFVIYDEDDKKKLVKDCVKYLGYEHYDIDFKRYISRAKESRIDPVAFVSAQISLQYDAETIAQVYALYERRLREYNAMDFNDLLNNVIKLFEEHEEVLKYYQDKFKYILVDEYQDTNHVQYILISMLAAGYGNICVCGDDDQSIYAFRGADIRNILEFEKDFPNVLTVRLEQNYRSTKTIIEASNTVIEKNSRRKGKTMYTKNLEGEQINVRICYDGREEARFIIGEMLRLSEEEDERLNNMAILYRTNAQSRLFEEMLLSANIPYRLFGGMKFYDREEIKDMMAYLKLAVNPNDNVSFMRIINVPRRGLGPGAIQKLNDFAEFKSTSLFDAAALSDEIPTLTANARRGAKEFYSIVAQVQEMIKEEVSIASIVKSLVEMTNYEAYLHSKPENAEQKIENLNELISSIVEFEKNSEERSVSAYLQHISLISVLDGEEDELDKVTLMTMHNAKGLEFDTVFLAGMEEGLFPHMTSVMEGSDEEERRLCYVGMTRAKKRLYMTAAKERAIRGRYERRLPSRFLFEVDKQYLDEIGKNMLYTIEKQQQKRMVFEDDLSQEAEYATVKPIYGRYNRKNLAKEEKLQAKSGSEQAFEPGDKIMHTAFGIGTVIAIKGEGAETILQVAFVQAGIKNLLKDYAPITKA